MDKIDMVFQMVSDLQKQNTEDHAEIKRMMSNQRAKLAALAATISTIISAVAWMLR